MSGELGSLTTVVFNQQLYLLFNNILLQYNNPSELRVLAAQAMLEYRSLAFRQVHKYVISDHPSLAMPHIATKE